MNKATDDSIVKIQFILSTKIREDAQNELKLQYIVRLLFSNELKPEDIIPPNIKKEALKLLYKLIDLIYILFKMNQRERDILFRNEVTSIKNNNIKEIVSELEVLQNIEVKIQNTKIDNLCEIIMKSLLKEKYTLNDYIDTVFANLSFFPGLDMLLKFEVYTKIMKDYFNSPTTINFDETEINVKDEISVEIILDLFKKVPGDELFIQSLVILYYESNKHIIKKYNKSQILKAIEITFINITQGIEIARIIYSEKVLGDFKDALKHLNSEDNTIKSKKK